MTTERIVLTSCALTFTKINELVDDDGTVLVRHFGIGETFSINIYDMPEDDPLRKAIVKLIQKRAESMDE